MDESIAKSKAKGAKFWPTCNFNIVNQEWKESIHSEFFDVNICSMNGGLMWATKHFV